MENKVKIITAKVLKIAMDKSAVVSVERLVKHPVNGKFIKRSTNTMSMMRIISALWAN